VDVRDVARAFAAATTADAIGETLLIGGDETHRLVQGDVAPAMAAAMGLVGGLPTGLKGNPDSDADWFNTDWMDTTRAQTVLRHQHHSWPEMLIETANKAGARRHLLRVAAPLTKAIFTRRAAYHGRTEPYADPWGAIAAKWADPRPEEGA
jgi:nucleoside-diphosphate-sugar epimerase